VQHDDRRFRLIYLEERKAVHTSSSKVYQAKRSSGRPVSPTQGADIRFRIMRTQVVSTEPVPTLDPRPAFVPRPTPARQGSTPATRA
jgi:hypothetical protein